MHLPFPCKFLWPYQTAAFYHLCKTLKGETATFNTASLALFSYCHMFSDGFDECSVDATVNAAGHTVFSHHSNFTSKFEWKRRAPGSNALQSFLCPAKVQLPQKCSASYGVGRSCALLRFNACGQLPNHHSRLPCQMRFEAFSSLLGLSS